MRKLKLDELKRVGPAAFKVLPKFSVSVILDDVRSRHNIGSVFRTADAFKIETLYLCGICARPPHREIHKTALGATESVNWIYAQNIISLLEELRNQGYLLLAIEQTDQSLPLQTYHFNPTQKYAFIFGNEFSGVDDRVLKHVSGALEVPQFGTKHSLNLAVCVGIVLWDYVSKRLKTSPFKAIQSF